MTVTEFTPIGPEQNTADFSLLRLSYPSLYQKASLSLGQNVSLEIKLQPPRHKRVSAPTTITLSLPPAFSELGHLSFIIPTYQPDSLRVSQSEQIKFTMVFCAFPRCAWLLSLTIMIEQMCGIYTHTLLFQCVSSFVRAVSIRKLALAHILLCVHLMLFPPPFVLVIVFFLGPSSW